MEVAAASFSVKAPAFILLLVLSIPVIASLEVEDPVSLLDRQTAQLDRLEALVEGLSRTVSALESSLSACPTPRVSVPLVSDSASPEAVPRVAVRKHKPLWSERFQFAAAVQLESEASCAAVLPYEDLDGLSKYFAVGDNRGRVYIFSVAGDVVLELPAISDAPVTAILAYLSFRKNESLLFTGHADGSIVAHRLWESVANDWLTLSLGSSRSFTRGGRDLDSPAVMGIEVHQVGRTRYILAFDDSGRIRVFTDNGTLYGTAISSSRPLAFMKQRLLFLTETGAGSLDLRSMVVKEMECEGLNGSVIKSYSFDESEWTKAYGFTADGDLIHVILLGDVANLKCRVRSIRKSEIESPVSIRAIRGYLLVASLEKVLVYNISSQYYGRVGAPRPLFSATLQEIKLQFLSSEASEEGFPVGNPLIAVDREKLVVLGLGGGCIGIYRSNFPLYKIETNAVVWSAPALVFLLFLIGIWQFYVKKKDALGWTPDEAFNDPGGASTGILGPTTGERASEFRNLRGGTGLRAPSRRYVSPPRYPGGSSMPYRPSTSGESGFRANADLKYRGQNIEPKRREPLFQNSDSVDEHSD